MKITIDWGNGVVREFHTANEPEADDEVYIKTKSPASGDEIFEVKVLPRPRNYCKKHGPDKMKEGCSACSASLRAAIYAKPELLD